MGMDMGMDMGMVMWVQARTCFFLRWASFRMLATREASILRSMRGIRSGWRIAATAGPRGGGGSREGALSEAVWQLYFHWNGCVGSAWVIAMMKAGEGAEPGKAGGSDARPASLPPSPGGEGGGVSGGGRGQSRWREGSVKVEGEGEDGSEGE